MATSIEEHFTAIQTLVETNPECVHEVEQRVQEMKQRWNSLKQMLLALESTRNAPTNQQGSSGGILPSTSHPSVINQEAVEPSSSSTSQPPPTSRETEKADRVVGESSVERAGLDVTSIAFKWENKVLVLSPTVEEWADFPRILRCAKHHGGHLTGVIKVEVPQPLQQWGPAMLTLNTLKGCYVYTISDVDQFHGQFQTTQEPSPSLLDRFTPSIPDSMSTLDALAQLQELLEENNLKAVQYLPDVPITTEAERTAAGLPPSSLIWPLAGDRLSKKEEEARIPGIDTPFGYLSGNQFGALFNFHVEDHNLHSLSHLHQGRKIWIIIPPEGKKAFEQRLSTPELLGTWGCGQFVRHNNL
ncbi:hypothetical protein MMC22_008936 [Lobaria immixta]|nr:hypothetical protein [Lobaria immixta]